jgi:hypothetical protein
MLQEPETIWQHPESAEHATPFDLSFGGKPNVTEDDLRNSCRLFRADCNFELPRYSNLRKQEFDSFLISISRLAHLF